MAMMTPGMPILDPGHLAVMTSKYWGAKGARLTVAFLESVSVELRERILAHMNAWGEHGNVSFEWSTTEPMVRVTRAQEGYWSYLGTDILHIAKGEPTMCLSQFTMNTSEAEFRRVVRHETGHTLGFPHEHMRKAIVDQLDTRKTIDYFRRTQGWSAAMTQAQVLTPLAEESLLDAPDADETSIMTYSLPALITKTGQPIIGGNDIAPQDIAYIAKIYPKPTTEPSPPPPVVVGTGLSLHVDFEKKTVFVKALPGWKVAKAADVAGATTDMCQDKLNEIANRLECEVLPQDQQEVDAAKQSALGGTVGAVLGLIAALRSGDMMQILTAFKKLIDTLVPDESLQFAPQAARFKIDWKKLVATLAELLPLILG